MEKFVTTGIIKNGNRTVEFSTTVRLTWISLSARKYNKYNIIKTLCATWFVGIAMQNDDYLVLMIVEGDMMLSSKYAQGC